MIRYYDIGSGLSIGEDDVAQHRMIDPNEYRPEARLTTVDEAMASESVTGPAPAAVLSTPVDELLARVSGAMTDHIAQ